MEQRNTSEYQEDEGIMGALKAWLPSGRKVMWGFVSLFLLAAAFLGGGLIETKEADDILGIQSAWDGKITWYVGTEPWVWQNWGTTVVFKKRSIYSFDAPDTTPEGVKKGRCLNGIEVRFNDGGHGTICGSVQFEMPVDDAHLNSIFTKFKTQSSVQGALIETITGKSVYLAGPMMSSRESYAEKRNDLLYYIEDQIQNGVYKTRQREDHVKDSITGAEKTATITEIVLGKDGKAERQEVSVLTQFGIKAFNFAIKRLPYDDKVEEQIKAQQELAMAVQTSMSTARKAEQDTLTTVEKGKQTAAEAKWKQEAIKATEVTRAEQEKAVAIVTGEKERDYAKLQRDAAEFYKQQQILKGEGDGAYRRKVMEANGALEQKLETFKEVMGKFAVEFGKQKWVPEVQMGGGGAAAGGNPATDMIQGLNTMVYKQLALDMKMEAQRRAAAATEEAPAPAKAPVAKPTAKK